VKQPIRKLNERRATQAARPLRHVVAALIVRDGSTDTPGPTNGSAGDDVLLPSGLHANDSENGGPNLTDPTREVFICQRRPDQPMALKWEFPGGKVEPGETSVQALARELSEELGIDATIGPHITTIRHTYRNGGAIEIEFFAVNEFEGDLDNRIFHQMLWSPVQRLPDYDFLAADLTLIRDLADGKLL
jgi:8-oxo-dGTP diphosphatase